MKVRQSIRLAAAVLAAAALPTVAWATPLDGLDGPNNGQSSEHRQDDFVSICHHTDEHSAHEWITVQVDGDAWAEHTSAHSGHELDFLVDEEHPCPPVPDVPPIPPRLTQWCFPAVNLGEVVLQLDGGGEATLVDNSAYVLLTFEPNDFNLHLVGALGGREPEDDQTPCPLRDTPVVTPTPPVTSDSPVVEVSDSGLQQQAQQFNPDGVSAAQAEVAAPADQLPYTGVPSPLLAGLGSSLAGVGLYLRRRFRV